MSQPLVSICVPNLNKRQFLPERMETLLAQTFTDWEMIVCDSYSDDGSWEFFQKFKNDPRIRLYQVPRAGLYAGWNECLNRARGEYINIATSDDTADPKLLEKLIEPLESRRNLHLALCDFTTIDADSKRIPTRRYSYRSYLGDWLKTQSVRNGHVEFLLNVFFITTWLTMAAVLFRRELIAKTGLFPTDLKSHGDTEWILRACLATDIAYVPEALTTFRIYGEQATPAALDVPTCALYCSSLKRILADPDAGLPNQWLAKSGADVMMLGTRRVFYEYALHSLDLYRWIAKSDPRRFFHGIQRAWNEAPGFLFSQAARGFPLRNLATQELLESNKPVEDLLNFFGEKFAPSVVASWQTKNNVT
jgi:glycosyltransferase involved in cell wall biosynthesis